MTDPRDIPPRSLALPLDGWLDNLVSADADKVERAREELGGALASADEAMRSRAAQLLLRALERNEVPLVTQSLALLQGHWYPPPAHMAEQAVSAVLGALARLQLTAEPAQHAALLLANLCQQAPGQIDVLGAALRRKAAAVRLAAAGALGRLGAVSRPRCTELVELLHDDDTEVAAAALDAVCVLAPLDPEAAAGPLLTIARQGAGARRHRALIGLRGLLAQLDQPGQPRPDALERAGAALVAASESPDAATRAEAVACMGLLRARKRRVIDALVSRLEDEDTEVTAASATSLLTLKPKSKAALARLEELLHADDEEQQRAAVVALSALEPRQLGEGALGALLKKLADSAPDPLGNELRLLLLRDQSTSVGVLARSETP